MIGYLNINSLRNKHVSIEELVKGNIEVFLLSKTRLYETFPYKQFEIQGYKIFQKDRKKHGGGGVMFSLRGHTFMTSTKYYEFCDPPAPSSAKMNNRSFV